MPHSIRSSTVMLRTGNGASTNSVDASATHNGGCLQFTIRDAAPGWLSVAGDAFLAALLMPVMALGEELVIEAPVSTRLHRCATAVMGIYAAWWGGRYQPVSLRCAAPDMPAGAVGAGAVGLYFTGGVDSFYSLLKDVELSGRSCHDPVAHLL